MKLCRFQNKAGDVRVGLVSNSLSVLDVTAAGIRSIEELLESGARAVVPGEAGKSEFAARIDR